MDGRDKWSNINAKEQVKSKTKRYGYPKSTSGTPHLIHNQWHFIVNSNSYKATPNITVCICDIQPHSAPVRRIESFWVVAKYSKLPDAIFDDDNW